MVAIEAEKKLLNERYKEIISSAKVVLIMKGNPKFPMCGLSSTVCWLLKKNKIDFAPIDILADPEFYEFLRSLHGPEVFPYMYVQGNFIGGYDKIVSLLESGEFFNLYNL